MLLIKTWHVNIGIFTISWVVLNNSTNKNFPTSTFIREKNYIIGNPVTGHCIMQGLGVNKTYPCKGCAQNCLENEGFQKMYQKCSPKVIMLINEKKIRWIFTLKLTLKVRFWHYFAYIFTKYKNFHWVQSMARANLKKSNELVTNTTKYLRVPESASVEIPPFRPKFTS